MTLPVKASYRFSVVAHNALGVSPASWPSNSVSAR
jgi:hypothetical protein